MNTTKNKLKEKSTLPPKSSHELFNERLRARLLVSTVVVPLLCKVALRGVSTHWTSPVRPEPPRAEVRLQGRSSGRWRTNLRDGHTHRCSLSCDTCLCGALCVVSLVRDCVRVCVRLSVSTVVSFFVQGALRGVSTHWASPVRPEPARLPFGRDSGTCLDLTQWTHHYPVRCALRDRIPSHLLSSCSTTAQLETSDPLCQSRSLGLPCGAVFALLA